MNGSKTKVENFTTKNGSGKQLITMNPENKQKAQKGRHACRYFNPKSTKFKEAEKMNT